ncbi:glycosyltransferase family 9 protein, partial [Vibrio cholerae]
LKNYNRLIRNTWKKLKLRYYCKHYDKAPIETISWGEIHSLAILRWDNKLGDAIMSGLFIKTLQTLRPDIKVSVITPNFCAHWFEKATGCHIIRCSKRSLKTARSFHQYQGQFDAVIELGTSFDFKELIALHELGAPFNIGFNKETHPIFNVVINNKNVHFKDRYLAVAKLFTNSDIIESIPLIPFSNSNIVSRLHYNVAINFFGSSKYRQFSLIEAKKFLTHWLRDFPNEQIYLIPVPGKMDFLNRLVNEVSDDRVTIPNDTPSLEFTLQLLSQVDLCVTPDTSVVHMASALNTPTLAIYADNPRNFQEWHPLSEKNAVVFNPATTKAHSRVYVYDFDWSDLKKSKESLLTADKLNR